MYSGKEIMEEIHHRIPQVDIRDEQIDALDAIQENEEAGNRSSLIVMPPGLGKTVVLAADTRRRLLENPQARSLFLCDSNNILNQARGRFQQIVGPEFSYGLFSGDGRDYDELSVLFGSFQVMKEWRNAFLKDEFQIGMVDESHHSKAPTYEPTLDYFDFGHLLGATATPDRFDILDIRDIFGSECYILSLEEAIAQRKLAAVDYYVITDRVAETGEVFDDFGVKYPVKDFNSTVFAPERDREIVDIAQQYAATIKNPKTIGFCKSIEQAEVFANLYGDQAAAFHSDLTRKAQKELLDQFRDGNITALFTVSMFDEGIDIPEANQILFLRATDSKRIYLQQLGRGLRKTALKKRVQVLDFVNNAERLLLVDRVWSTIRDLQKTEPEIPEIHEIEMSDVHFSEASKDALKILKNIERRVYPVDQVVPEGSLLATRLAKELGMTRSAVLALAASLNIAPEIFPSLRGSRTPYFVAEDVERLRLASNNLFE